MATSLLLITPLATGPAAAATATRTTISGPTTAVEVGSPARITVQTAPARPGTRVLLQELSSGSWRTVQYGAVDARSRRVFTVNKAKGRYAFRGVTPGGSGFTASTSPTATLVVKAKERSLAVAYPQPVITSYYTSSKVRNDVSARVDAKDVPHSVVFNSVDIVDYGGVTTSAAYPLGRAWQSVRGVLGVTDGSAPGAKATVEVVADGRPLASYDVSLGSPRSFALPVAGVSTLQFRTSVTNTQFEVVLGGVTLSSDASSAPVTAGPPTRWLAELQPSGADVSYTAVDNGRGVDGSTVVMKTYQCCSGKERSTTWNIDRTATTLLGRLQVSAGQAPVTLTIKDETGRVLFQQSVTEQPTPLALDVTGVLQLQFLLPETKGAEHVAAVQLRVTS